MNCADCPNASPGAVIFDCDGVLIDSWDANIFAYNHIRQAVGLPPMSEEEEQFVFVSTIDESLDHIIPRDLRPRAYEAWAALPLTDLLARIRLQPGVVEFLRLLREHGIGTAANTNGGSEVHPLFEALGLTPYFDIVVTAEDVVRPKPDPEGVRRILAYFNIGPDEAVFIGDSAVDLSTARSARVSFWSYRNPDLDADLHVTDFPDLGRRLPDMPPLHRPDRRRPR